MAKLVVISDLHLWGPEDPLYRALLRFMEGKLENGDRLFIVGDLFDLFVGSKAVFVERYHELISAIRALGDRGIEVFYLEGNHDFHLENLFDDSPHVRLYGDSLHYEWDGRKFFFCHGDRINWKDIGYQLFRLLTRNLFTQCLIEVAPGALIDRVGSTMSRASRGYNMESSDETVRLFRNYACERISNSGYDFVIMGHSHFHDDIRFRVGGHEGQYINVGYPRKHRRYFQISEGDAVFQSKLWEEISPLRPLRAASSE